MIPFTRDAVPDVRVGEGRITILAPEPGPEPEG